MKASCITLRKRPVVSTAFKGMKTASAMVGDTLGQEFRRKLFSSVHSNFGGKLRLRFPAAALEKSTGMVSCFGFNIVEGYGTETLALLHSARRNDPGWVCRPILGEMK